MNASQEVYDFIDRLNKEPETLKEFETDKKSVLDTLSLDQVEYEALLDGSPEMLASIGLKPLVLMRYMLAQTPAFKEHISLVGYFDEIFGEDSI